MCDSTRSYGCTKPRDAHLLRSQRFLCLLPCLRDIVFQLATQQLVLHLAVLRLFPQQLRCRSVVVLPQFLDLHAELVELLLVNVSRVCGLCTVDGRHHIARRRLGPRGTNCGVEAALVVSLCTLARQCMSRCMSRRMHHSATTTARLTRDTRPAPSGEPRPPAHKLGVDWDMLGNPTSSAGSGDVLGRERPRVSKKSGRPGPGLTLYRPRVRCRFLASCWSNIHASGAPETVM